MSENLLVWHYGYADMAIVQYDELRKFTSRPVVEIFTVSPMADHRFSEATRAYVSVIVFSQMALEAYINAYGISRLGPIRWKKHLKGKGFTGKWILTPKMVTEKEFPTNGQGYCLLKRLVEIRNDIVHGKPEYIGSFPDLKLEKLEKLDPRKHLVEAEDAIKAMYELHADLLTIDPVAPSIVRGGKTSEFTELCKVESDLSTE